MDWIVSKKMFNAWLELKLPRKFNLRSRLQNSSVYENKGLFIEKKRI